MADLGLIARIQERMRREGLKPLTKKSREWLRDKVSGMSKRPDRDKLLREAQTVPNALVGSLYMFYYSPKFQNDETVLPYYDRFPLVLPFSEQNDRFTGLNLHYVDYVTRVAIFDRLLRLANNRRFDRSTRLRLSWEAIVAIANMPAMRACIHTYLNSHVSSRFIYVDPSEYEVALFLPVHQFVRANAGRVWRDSLRGGPRA